MRFPRWLKNLSKGLALLIGIIGVCGIGLLGTETGRLWLAERALSLTDNSGMAISIKDLSSPSLGQWRARSITVMKNNIRLVEVHDLALHWYPSALFSKHLKINALTANRLEYYHPTEADSSASSGPTPHFPLRLSVNQLRIQSLGVHQLPTVQGRQLPNYRLQAEAELFGPVYPLQLQLELQSLASEQTRLSIQTQVVDSGEVNIQGSVAEEPGGLLGSLARWPEDDPLQAQFRLNLVQGEQVLHLALEELNGQLVGHTLQAAGTLDYRKSDRSLHLQELELLVDGKRQRLRGGYSPADLWAEVNLAELPLDLITPWYPDIASGTASGRFDLSWLHREAGLWPRASADLQGEVEYANKRLVLNVEGTLEDKLLRLEPSLLHYGTAELQVQGSLDFAGTASDLSGTLKQFHTDLLIPWRIPVPEGLTAATEEARFRLRGALSQPEVVLVSVIKGIYKEQPFELAVDGEGSRQRANLRSLHLSANASEIRAQGLIDWSGGVSDLQASFKDLRGELLRLAPPAVSDRLPEGLSLLANGEATFSGPWTTPTIQSRSRISGTYQLKGETLPYRIELDGTLATGRSDKMKIAAKQVEVFLFDQLTLSLSGHYSAQAMDLHLRLNQLPTLALAALGWQNIEGTATADLHLTGTLAKPLLAGHVEYSDTLTGDGARMPLKLRTEVSTKQEQLVLDTDLRRDQELLGQMLISLPAYLYLQPHTGPLPLNLHAEGEWELRSMRLFTDLGIHRLEGRTKVNLTFSGNVEQPVVRGQLQLEGGTYHNRSTGTLLEDIKLALVGDGERLLIQEARARSGDDGELQLTGAVFWQPERRQLQDAVNLTLNIKRANLLQRNDLQGEVAGNVQVSGSFAELWVKGELEVSPLNASVDSAIRTRIPQIRITEVEASTTGEGSSNALPVVNLDVRLKAEQQAYLRGRGLDTELAGSIAVTGTLNRPQYRGLFNTRRGRLELFGKRFVLEEGEVRFNNSGVIMRIPAVHKTQEIEIRAELHGTADEPKLSLSSIPALPEDEILSRLIFGKSAQDISAFEAIRLAAAVRSLTSGGGFDPVDSARSLLGVDSLTIDSETADDGDSNYTLGIGKYLNERVYVELGRSSNPSQPWSGAIEVELTPSVILESRTNQTGGTGAVLLWKRDY